jgi:hypothetical protein
MEVLNHEVSGDEFGGIDGHLNDECVDFFVERDGRLAQVVLSKVERQLLDTLQKHEKRPLLHLVQVVDNLIGSLFEKISNGANVAAISEA